jgi:hypothetical protein
MEDNMKKNIALIILTLALAVVTVICINANYKIKLIEKQLDEHNTSDKSRITLYEDNVGYGLFSNDGKLRILFTYDEQGLNKSFGLIDELSGKKFGFNYEEDGNLANFFYEDEQFNIINNVASSVYPEKLIEGVESINGFIMQYSLFPDGTTEINVRR